jgi:osmotically inducible lipoprotein OsmB
MKKQWQIVIAMILCLSMTGCSNVSKRDVGMMGGAVGGGLLGHAIGGNTAGTVVGAAGGAYLGSKVMQNQR